MKNKILSVFAAALVVASGLLQAAPTVLVYEWNVAAGKAGEFAAALDTLQKSDIAKDRTAQLHLEAVGFNGANPATHRVVVLYRVSLRWSHGLRSFKLRMRAANSQTLSTASPLQSPNTWSNRLRVGEPCRTTTRYLTSYACRSAILRQRLPD